MQQIKLFKGLESDVVALEGEVNKWLTDSGVRVINMFGNIAPQSASGEVKHAGLSKRAFAPSDVLLVILYEKN